MSQKPPSPQEAARRARAAAQQQDQPQDQGTLLPPPAPAAAPPAADAAPAKPRRKLGRRPGQAPVRYVTPADIDREAPADMPGLTLYQHAFVREIMTDWNATQAIMRAGYVPPADSDDPMKLAATAAANMKAEKVVRIWLAWFQAKLARRCGISSERIVAEIASIAFVDPLSLFAIDEETKRLTMLSLAEMSPADRRAIKELTITTDKEGKQTLTLKFYDKGRALQHLGLHLNLFKMTHVHEDLSKKPADATGPTVKERTLRADAQRLRAAAGANGGATPAGGAQGNPGRPALPPNGGGKTVH